MESMEKTVGNKITFRMSSAGRCARALSAQLLNMEAEPAPSWLEQAAEEGNWHEDRIATREQAGKRQLEVVLDYPSFQLIGHIDGIVTDEGNLQLLEVKSMSQFEFDRWMRGRFNEFPAYATQVTLYMEATKLDQCLYIVKNRNSGYEDRQVIEKPQHMTEIIGHLTDVTNHVIGNQLVPHEFDPQSIECRRCEYKRLCLPEPEELKPATKELLDKATEEYRKGKQLEAMAKELINASRQVLEQHTRATNQIKWQFNGLAIQLVHYKESLIYPKAKLLKCFTEEQLQPASELKEAFDQLRITDIEAEK